MKLAIILNYFIFCFEYLPQTVLLFKFTDHLIKPFETFERKTAHCFQTIILPLFRVF